MPDSHLPPLAQALHDQACPCGSQRDYAHCCEPFHSGREYPARAEQLMRSRYCAFALHNADYLLATLHHSRREHESVRALQDNFTRYRWTALQIQHCELGSAQDNKGTVTFSAHYVDTVTGKPGVLAECSRFVKEDGRWYYQYGDITHTGQQKTGRNDPCWCGSGRKFKKCHGA